MCACFPPIECVLVACLCAVDTSSEGEEGFIGEECVGEDRGQPEPTGKPPLALAYLLSYSICI